MEYENWLILTVWPESSYHTQSQEVDEGTAIQWGRVLNNGLTHTVKPPKFELQFFMKYSQILNKFGAQWI